MFRDKGKCSMKDGNPFGPFWNHFGVSFDGSVEHPGLLWDTYFTHVAEGWNKRYCIDFYYLTYCMSLYFPL